MPETTVTYENVAGHENLSATRSLRINSDTSADTQKKNIEVSDEDELPDVTGVENRLLTNNHPSSSKAPNYAILNFVKTYNQSQDKYTGAFDAISTENSPCSKKKCEISGVRPDDRLRVLSTVLSGSALQYYLDIVKPNTETF